MIWFDCWQCDTQCYGDATCAKEGSFQVSIQDLIILTAAFDTELGDLLYDECADHNRDLKVNQDDLDILEYWYNKMSVPTDCPTTP